MRLVLQVPVTMRQRREHEAELRLYKITGSLVEIPIELEQFSPRGCQEILDTIAAGRIMAGVTEIHNTLLEEALMAFRDNLGAK